MARTLQIRRKTSEATPETLSEEDICLSLEEVYRSIPATKCSSCGTCCEVTQEERRQGWVTMYPLYAVEYLHIAAYVAGQFASKDRNFYLGFREEWPLRCPFRDQEKRGCVIYPVRPMTCRTYGVLNEQRIDEAVAAHRNRIPSIELERFRRWERHHICPNVQVVEEDKLDAYMAHRIEFWYTKQLEVLSVKVDVIGPEKRQAFEEITGRPSVLSWTWGGFNTLRFSSAEAFVTQFPAYWKKAELPR